MDDEEPKPATKAARLAQLADLLRDGVLSDVEYKAALSRLPEDSRTAGGSASSEYDADPDPITQGEEATPSPTQARSRWQSRAVVLSSGVTAAIALAVGLTVGGVFKDEAPPVAEQPAATLVPIQDDLDEEIMADIIWSDVGEGFCIDSVGDLAEGLTFDDIKETFLNGYDNSVAGYGRRNPLADGGVVFDILWQRCVDLGY